jgi:hypothetical protein
MRRVSLSVPVDLGPMGLDLGKGGNGKVEPRMAHVAAVFFTFFVFACGYGFVYGLCVWALCMGFVYGLCVWALCMGFVYGLCVWASEVLSDGLVVCCFGYG